MSDSRLLDYLAHMHLAAADACSFVNGQDKGSFLSDKRTQQAVVMSLLIIGEAATKVMDGFPDFAAGQPQIPWRSMRGMRNRIAHGYFEIDHEIVWETVHTALPPLLTLLTHAIEAAKDGHAGHEPAP